MKEWEIVISSGGAKFRGVLNSVTDSSVIFSAKNGFTDEIMFRDIDKIKLRRLHGRNAQILAGFFIGGITGGVITGTLLAAGKAGEPRALAGVVGGIGGGIIFGVAGILVAQMLSTKKIAVKHDPAYFSILKQKLIRYCTRY